MLKRIFKYLFGGIAWGCTFFVIINLIGYFTVGEVFLEPIIENYPVQALGAMATGICCGTSAIVYTFEKLPFWVCVLVHFGVGLTGYLGISFALGWMPKENLGQVIAFVITGILVYILIWSGFYFYNRYEAKKMNDQLKQMEDTDDLK